MARKRLSATLATCTLLTLAAVGCEARYPPRPEVWVDPPPPSHEPNPELPPGTDEGVGEGGSLLQAYADRAPRGDEELATWALPYQAKTMIVELLIAAGKDDAARIDVLLTDDARWGLPDRRELRGRAIQSESDPLGLRFLESFRRAASRFSNKASFTCTPMQPGWQLLAGSGAEPVWCSYTSSDGLDIMAFRLVVERGQVKTDYVGFFLERQSEAIRVAEAGDPPPLTPYVKRPVSLELPELMPDGSNPVVERPKPRPKPAPAPEPEPEPEPETDVDEPIPVEADKPKPKPKPEPKPAKADPPAEPKPKPKPKPKPEPAKADE